MDQERLKEELQFRREQAEYYFGVTKDTVEEKLEPLPKSARFGVVFLLFALILLLMLKACGAGGGSTSEVQKPEVVTMPNLSMVSKIDAEQKLSNLGLNNLQESPVNGLAGSDPSDPDIIVDQSPKAGSVVKVGDKVLLSYASKSLYEKSKVNTTIPDVVGVLVPKATQIFKEKGFANVNFPIRTDASLKDDMLVVSSVAPDPGTPATLNTPIKVKVEPGFDMDDVKKKLADSYIPYNTFNTIERTTDRNLKITLKQNAAPIKTQKDADAAARVHKLGVERVLGEKIDGVTLIIPGANFIGDSKRVELSSTASGITVDMAHQRCEDEAKGSYTDVKVDWDHNTLLKTVDPSYIALMATASAIDDNGGKQNVVLSCTVSGSPTNMQVSNFSLQ